MSLNNSVTLPNSNLNNFVFPLVNLNTLHAKNSTLLESNDSLNNTISNNSNQIFGVPMIENRPYYTSDLDNSD